MGGDEFQKHPNLLFAMVLIIFILVIINFASNAGLLSKISEDMHVVKTIVDPHKIVEKTIKAVRHYGGDAVHALGGAISTSGGVVSDLGTAIAGKNTFTGSPVKTGEYMHPFIPAPAYGQGGYTSMMIGNSLSDAITTGQSWNPPNVSGCDCTNPNGNFINTIYSSSMPSLSSFDTSAIPMMPPGGSMTAAEQAAFYNALNTPSAADFNADVTKISENYLANSSFTPNDYGASGVF